MRKENKTHVIITVDTEFSSHKDKIGIFGKINGREYGIDKIMNICDKYNVKATFFVDVYGYKKFNDKAVVKDVCLQIHTRGHDVQLHTHPDGMYDKKRGYMAKYSLDEQIKIIKDGKELVKEWIKKNPIAHRAGDWGVDINTLRALKVNNIPVDSSVFEGWPCCNMKLKMKNKINLLNGIVEISPTTYISPSLGIFKSHKIIDIDANPLLELKGVIKKCRFYNINPIVIVLHSFSFLLWNKTRTKYKPDYSDIKKFDLLIQWLKQDKQVHFITIEDFYFLYKEKRLSENLSSGVVPNSGLFLSLWRALNRTKKLLKEII